MQIIRDPAEAARVSGIQFGHAGCYFRKLRPPIAICVAVCALVGASLYGLKGFFLSGLLGFIAPVALRLMATG